jgi:hypothetical protein
MPSGNTTLIQLIRVFRVRHLALHRWIGRVYVSAGGRVTRFRWRIARACYY